MGGFGRSKRDYFVIHFSEADFAVDSLFSSHRSTLALDLFIFPSFVIVSFVLSIVGERDAKNVISVESASVIV